MKKIKIHKGALIGRFFHDFNSAVRYYNKISETMRKRQCVVEVSMDNIPRYLIVGNSQLEAIKL